MKDLLTNMFKAKDKADQELREAQKEMIEKQYQKDMDQKRAYNSGLVEQARQMQNAAAQQRYGQAIPKQEGGLIQGGASGYGYGWNDPREMAKRREVTIEELHQNVAQANQTVKVLFEKVARAERKVEQLSGFYHWITEVHPELAAQYKAMRELYDAANNTGDTVPGEAMGS